MELFTYLMAKNDHNTSVKKDLFSYLLGKSQSGTYTDYSGTSLSINNTKKSKMKVNLLGNTSQTGTPTPSSPIPVNVVSGDNEVVVCGKNLWSTIIVSYNAPGETSTVGQGYNRSKNFVLVQPNTQYIFSSKNSVVDFRGNLYFYDNDKNVISQIWTYNTPFTTPNDCHYISLVGSVERMPESSEIQLELGNSSSSYEPYQGSTYPINLPVENLFDTELEQYGRNNTDGETTVWSTSYIRTKNKIKVQPNTTYFISYQYNAAFNSGDIQQYQANNTYISNIALGSSPKSFTTSNNCYYINIQWYRSSGITPTDITNIMLEKGTKANSYTPYGTTPIELCKIGTYQDKFFKNIPNTPNYINTLEDNEWYLEKHIGKVVLNGNESYFVNGQTSAYNQFGTNYVSGKKYGSTNFICNKFTISATQNQPYLMGGRDNSVNVVFNLLPTDCDYTTAGVKTWMASNQPTLYYVLNTPTYTKIEGTLKEELEAVWRAYSYNGQTNVTQSNNDLPFELSVSVKVGN